MYKIVAGSFNLIYHSLVECKEAIKRFNLTHYVVWDCQTGKKCFHS